MAAESPLEMAARTGAVSALEDSPRLGTIAVAAMTGISSVSCELEFVWLFILIAIPYFLALRNAPDRELQIFSS